MKKPLLLLMLLCSVFITRIIAQTATTVAVNGTSSTSSISNNIVTVVDPNLTISSDGTIAGFVVQITGSYTSGDVLSYSGALPSGISAGAFNTTSKSIQFTGTTDAASWQAFLRTVTIRTTSATCYPEQRQVSFIAGAKFYNPLNGHFYQLSPSTSNWVTGYTNANNSSYFGRQGYMVTITSAAENSFVSKILASDSWIGAADDYNYINTATGTTTYANQSAAEGHWYIVTGPEKGTNFSNGNGSPVTVSGQYHSWAGGEPNNAGVENFGEIYVASGTWNDLNGSQGYYTVVEYGGMSTDNTSAQVVFTRNLAITGAPSGTITGGNITVCSGTNSTTLTLSGLASGGSVVKWQYSYDNFLSTAIDIASSASTTYTVNNISQNTYYRAVVNTSSCSGLGTSSTYINVSNAVAGNIVADNNTICNGANVNFTLNGYSGSIVKWQVSTTSNFSSGVTDIANTTTSLSYNLATAGTYYFRTVVLSCSNTVYTSGYTISVISGTAPVGGSINSVGYCGGSNSGTLTLSGYTGTVSKWQYSTDGGVVWTDVANTTATLSYSAISATRRYRAILTNGSCGTAISGVGIITIYQASVAGTAAGTTSVCNGTNTSNVSLSGNTGTIQWQSSPNNSTFADIAGATSSPYTATNLSSTTYYRTVVTNGVCSAVNSNTVTITVKPTSTSITNTTICSSALPYSWNGLTFNAAGSQTKHLTNSVGCDSAATLNLTVNSPSLSTTNVSICSSSLPYHWNGLTLNASGTSTVHLTNSVGCDSAATLNLTVTTSTSSTTNTTVCPIDLPYSWNGLTFNAAGSQTAHLTNADGCDSAATLNLSVSSTSSTNMSVCPSALPYTWNGLTFNTAGSQTAYISIGNGCDSLATLNLSLLANSTSTSIVSICPTALPYTWNGLTFNTAGSQTAHFTNAAGCDSAATLGLIVLATSTSTTNTSICPSALPYSWNGLTFNAAGSQTAHFTNANGCDSAATLNLTVKANTTSTTNTSICPSALPYTWNGLTFNAAGSQTAHFTNAAGCDSAATLNLTVKANTTSTTNATVPFGGSYTFNGTTYTTAGTYTIHLTNAAGCDSAATLIFSIDPKPDAGADHSFACGSGILTDTIRGSLPTTGTWTSVASNPSSATLSATDSGVAVVTLPTAPFVGTISFIYTTGGGKDTMNINMTAPSGNPAPAVNMGTNPICKGATMQMCPTVYGWSNYQWYKNGVAIAAPNGVAACLTLDSTGAGSYTLAGTNGSGCWSAQSAPVVVTVTTCNTTCNAGLTAPCLITSYACTGSPTTLTYDLTTITLTCTKPNNTILEWHTGNPATAANVVSHPTTAAIGSYWAVYKDTINNCYANNGYATQNVTVDTCSNNVTSGVGGGLETKTLGDALAVRLYGNAIHSVVTTNAYNNNNKFTQSGAIVNGANSLTLSSLVPASVENTDAAYITTPTDLTNITNAVEVLAIDYTKANTTKAVTFATKTLGDVYAHTKPICDRLKGASLLEVKTVNVRGRNLVAYKVQQCSGEIEYAINLSAGTAANRNSISLQSKWFTDDYQQDEKLYNFQLWAVSYDMAQSMANDILQKLEANGTITQVNTANDLPAAYVSKGKRNENTISLTIQNNTTATTGYFELKQKLTETSAEVVKIVPITNLAANQSTVQLDVKDAYEATISLYINNNKTDMLYLNDGTWSNSYSASTSLNNFTVSADGNTNANADEYRLMRNVSFSANTKDYFSVYKTIGTGCNALDISSYKSIKFNANATGAGSVTVTLVSNNITDWKNQYSYTMNLEGNQEYAISLAKFKSGKYNTPVNANEITAVNFSFNNSRGVPTTMTASISNARFSKIDVVNASLTATLGIYPNPTTGKFTVAFTSDAAQALVLKVTEAATGRVVKTQFINATKGVNSIAIDNSLASGLYIVTLEGDNVKYNAAKLMVGKK